MMVIKMLSGYDVDNDYRVFAWKERVRKGE